jgi:hypothetical protein
MESASIALDRSPFFLGLHLPGLRGRFSTGIEQHPDSPANLRVGRFSSGIEQHPEAPINLRVGCFSDGIAQHPPVAGRLRHGSFADGYELIAQR